MHEIDTRIEINAPRSVVWELLTDLEGYQSWNPFVVLARGRIEVGEKLLCEPQMPAGRRYSFEPVVNEHRPGRYFSWVGNVLHPRIASGEHSFELREIGQDRTLLIHGERFTGIATRFMPRRVLDSTRRGFLLMNEALKRTAEQRVRNPDGS